MRPAAFGLQALGRLVFWQLPGLTGLIFFFFPFLCCCFEFLDAKFHRVAQVWPQIQQTLAFAPSAGVTSIGAPMPNLRSHAYSPPEASDKTPGLGPAHALWYSEPFFLLQIATRKAYGQALAKLGHASDRIIALDGDTKNSTFSELFKKEHPDRFIECYIAEQNMVSGLRGTAGHSCRTPTVGQWQPSSSSGQPDWRCQGSAVGQLRETTGATRTPR